MSEAAAKKTHTQGKWKRKKIRHAFGRMDLPEVFEISSSDSAHWIALVSTLNPVDVDLLIAAKDMLDYHKNIVALAEGWDTDGAIGPKSPLSWESVARMAMDYSQAAIAKAEGRYEQHVEAIAKSAGDKQ